MGARKAAVKRDTRETRISVTVDLDGTGRAELHTPVPFLDHMLDQVARHGMIDIELQAGNREKNKDRKSTPQNSRNSGEYTKPT